MNLGPLVALLVILALIVGWILNIVNFVQCDFEAPYKCEIVRAIGIPVAPIGGIVGYMNLGE